MEEQDTELTLSQDRNEQREDRSWKIVREETIAEMDQLQNK